jgi:hypothetical protein
VRQKRILWNEQYLLLAFLLCNDHFETLLTNQWLGLDRRDALAKAFPLLAQPGFSPLGGGSFWIRRVR